MNPTTQAHNLNKQRLEDVKASPAEDPQSINIQTEQKRAREVSKDQKNPKQKTAIDKFSESSKSFKKEEPQNKTEQKQAPVYNKNGSSSKFEEYESLKGIEKTPQKKLQEGVDQKPKKSSKEYLPADTNKSVNNSTSLAEDFKSSSKKELERKDSLTEKDIDKKLDAIDEKGQLRLDDSMSSYSSDEERNQIQKKKIDKNSFKMNKKQKIINGRSVWGKYPALSPERNYQSLDKAKPTENVFQSLQFSPLPKVNKFLIF